MSARHASVGARKKKGSISIRLTASKKDPAVNQVSEAGGGVVISGTAASPSATYDVRKVSVQIRLEDGTVHKREVCGRVHDAGILGKIVEPADELAAVAVARFWNHGTLFEVDDGLYVPLSKVAEIRLFGEQHLVEVTSE